MLLCIVLVKISITLNMRKYRRRGMLVYISVDLLLKERHKIFKIIYSTMEK